MDGDALSLISDGLTEVREGCRLPVRMKNTEDWPKAEVICIKQMKTGVMYYVHYVDYNKRLDEWVTEDRLDTRYGIEQLVYLLLVCNIDGLTLESLTCYSKIQILKKSAFFLNVKGEALSVSCELSPHLFDNSCMC